MVFSRFTRLWYAKVSKTDREKFETMIHEYLENRENLLYTFVLVDVRHEPQKLDIEFADALRMASLNPARFLKLDHELGRIAPGYRASLVHLDQKLNVLETWVDGA